MQRAASTAAQRSSKRVPAANESGAKKEPQTAATSVGNLLIELTDDYGTILSALPLRQV